MKLPGRSELQPDLVVGQLPYVELDILAAILRSRKIEKTWFDLDSTLVAYNDDRLPEVSKKFLKGMSFRGFKLGFLSNACINRTPRILGFADEGQQYVHANIDVVTSYMAGGSKPGKAIYDFAVDTYGGDRHKMAAFGDLILRDSLGANINGFGFSVLCEAFGESDQWLVEKIQRPIETSTLVRRWLNAPKIPQSLDILAVSYMEEVADSAMAA